jgi:hypothetical protein
MFSLQMFKELRARLSDRPTKWLCPSKNLGQERGLPEMVVVRGRYAVHLAFEGNKLYRDVLVPSIAALSRIAYGC